MITPVQPILIVSLVAAMYVLVLVLRKYAMLALAHVAITSALRVLATLLMVAATHVLAVQGSIA